jgi:molybdopterin-guanine dinucleotide biosynthesis protein
MDLKAKLKELYQNLTKTLPKNEQTLQKADQKQTETLLKTNQKITLASANKTTDFPLRVFIIIGKQGYGKTTLAKNIANYYTKNKIPIVNVQTLEDLEKQECVLVIDDLKDDLTKTIMQKIAEKFRAVRHSKQIIVLTHHVLNDVPTKLLELADKIIMFNNSFSVNSPTSKVHYIIAKNKKEALHELCLNLEHYHYVIVKEGKIYGKFENINIEPIVGDTHGAEIKLIANNGASAIDTNIMVSAINNTKIMEKLLEQVPEFELLTTTEKIITLKQTFPKLKPAVISRLVNTTPQNTWKTLSIARKKRLIS